LTLTLLVIVASAVTSAAREWTAQKIEGTLVAIDRGAKTVSIRTSSGKTLDLPALFLTDADKQYLAEHAKSIDVEQAQPTKNSRHLALLVGVDDYGRNVRDLRYCTADVKALQDQLVAIGFEKADIDCLISRGDFENLPTKDNIESRFDLLIRSAKPDDVVVLALSGHGVHLEGENYFCSADVKVDTPERLKASAVSLDDIYERFSQCPARFKLLIVDACRDDPFDKSTRTIASSARTLGNYTKSLDDAKAGFVALRSCRATEQSHESPDLGQGVFMYHIVEGLKGRADNAAGNDNGRVSLMELCNYATYGTSNYVRRTFKKTQTPSIQTYGEISDFDLTDGLADQFTNSLGMKFKLIPAGEFMMGSRDSAVALAEDYETKAEYFEDEYPRHRVRITKPYYLGMHEVTQGQQEKLMGTEPWRDKSYATANSSHGVSYVCWYDAVEFCNTLSEQEGLRPCYRLSSIERENDGTIDSAEVAPVSSGTGYRLPTEAQWEYACRAGTTTRFCFGDDESKLGDYAWFDHNANDVDEEYAHPVGQKKANAWGLYDMHGNVWEWCDDWYDEDYYEDSPVDDPSGPTTGAYRVFRGGGWRYGARYCRSASRGRNTPGGRSRYLGFRIALVPSE